MKVGNSLAVTLPRDAVAHLGLTEGDSVEVEVAERHIVIGTRGDLASLFESWRPVGRTMSPDAIVRAIREERDAR